MTPSGRSGFGLAPTKAIVFTLSRIERMRRLDGGAHSSLQSGWRFSRNAPMPSSASRASMFSTMTAAA